jgi:predicted O-methyltransferase YrrM
VNDAQYAALNRRLDTIEQRIRASSETTHRVTDRLQRRLYSQVEALIGLYRDLDGLPTLPPLRGWAVSPDTARLLHGLIKTYRPRHVLECGSGASTVMLGHLQMAGLIERVTSLDHEPLFFELTRQRLRTAGVLDVVDLRFAPLTDRIANDRTAPWYDIDTDGIEPVDLVIVDGPPSNTGPQARYPALPILAPVMNPGCLIVVDDYERQDELLMVDAWREQYPVELIALDHKVEKALAVLEYRPDRESLEQQQEETDR